MKSSNLGFWCSWVYLHQLPLYSHLFCIIYDQLFQFGFHKALLIEIKFRAWLEGAWYLWSVCYVLWTWLCYDECSDLVVVRSSTFSWPVSMDIYEQNHGKGAHKRLIYFFSHFCLKPRMLPVGFCGGLLSLSMQIFFLNMWYSYLLFSTVFNGN